MTARPLLARYWPELAELGQPLAGEYAAPRHVLQTVALAAGFGVDLALLLDVAARYSPAAIGQVDMDQRRHTNKPLSALGPMAEQVLATASARLCPSAPRSDRSSPLRKAGPDRRSAPIS